ncbi:hypothetical protein M9H77_11980 [Catharanthus roseus]|uniref:Uncharacterized protein n=1 Tax=Catharanthus roseus TaxID=4058 RepID=A0ACC0BG41_CATRO|nr:hypothetical protein M9H77_11980 [Catharanthus roseus]
MTFRVLNSYLPNHLGTSAPPYFLYIDTPDFLHGVIRQLWSILCSHSEYYISSCNCFWVSDHNIVPEPRFAEYPSRDVAEDVEPKASEIASSITFDISQNLGTLEFGYLAFFSSFYYRYPGFLESYFGPGSLAFFPSSNWFSDYLACTSTPSAFGFERAGPALYCSTVAFTRPPSIEKPYVSTVECEEFMRYLLSTTLAGGLSSRSRHSAFVQVSSPTSSLFSTSTAPAADGRRRILTVTHGKYVWRLREILLSSSQISESAWHFIKGDPEENFEEGGLAVSSTIPPWANPNVVSAPFPAAQPSLCWVPVSEASLHLLVTDKGKEASFLYQDTVPPLITFDDLPVFCPVWEFK